MSIELPADDDLLVSIEQLLADPAHRDNPLRAPFARLLAHCRSQQERMERLVRISDGYHFISRHQTQSVNERYDKQLRRLEKLARISDRYQNSLREMSEALKEAALRDALTGMGNRRFLMERLREETERAQRKASPYALAILDVDHFKAVNDCYGHDTGDKVLCAIGDAIQNSLREYDLCGRWGGEEFLILLPETGREAALQVAERVRSGIEQLVVDLPIKPPLKLSASLGVAVFQSSDNFSCVLNRADSALLQAKAHGRNRIEWA